MRNCLPKCLILCVQMYFFENLFKSLQLKIVVSQEKISSGQRHNNIRLFFSLWPPQSSGGTPGQNLIMQFCYMNIPKTEVLSRFWWKKICLYHVRQAEKPYYHASCGLMALQWRTRWVSTTGHWPWIYFSKYRVVVTGWQLTANRISAAGVFVRLTSTCWCGSHPTGCGSDAPAVLCVRCTMRWRCSRGSMRFAKTNKVRCQTLCLQ